MGHTLDPPVRPVGDLLRDWRQRRRFSQLALSLEAGISTRHLSFVESGRARPSRDMVLRLAERLDVPLRERNALLLAAGFAPAYRERDFDDPELAHVRQAIDLVLKGTEPFPALAIDRHWTMIAANRAVAPLLAGVGPALLAPPINVLRLTLHPDGLASRVGNLGQWRAHLFARLRDQIDATGDPVLVALLQELRGYPGPDVAAGDLSHHVDAGHIVVPFELLSPRGRLSFMTTTMMFGTPQDIVASELAIEVMFPADAITAGALQLPTIDATR